MRTLWMVPAMCLALLAACSGDKPQPAAPEATTPSALPEPPPTPPSAEPSAEPSAAPSASASAAPTTKPSSGRPPVLKTGDTEVADTFGFSPAARLELGSDKDMATLKIPENALQRATNVAFKIEKTGKSNGGQVGKIYHVIAVIPPNTTSDPLPSAGPPFELILPAGSKKDANLAVGEVTIDASGREKVKWSVIAPTKIDDASNLAYFELPALGNLYLHVTTKPVAPAK